MVGFSRYKTEYLQESFFSIIGPLNQKEVPKISPFDTVLSSLAQRCTVNDYAEVNTVL